MSNTKYVVVKTDNPDGTYSECVQKLTVSQTLYNALRDKYYYIFNEISGKVFPSDVVFNSKEDAEQLLNIKEKEL